MTVLRSLPGVSTQLEWALAYATIGWNVFPVNTGKVPLTPNGLNDASLDPGQIRRWWEKTPKAMIGVRTGAISGIVVLDYDAYKPGAADSFKYLVDNHGSFVTPVMAQSTGQGNKPGNHFYFTHPGIPTPNVVKLWGLEGLDIRGDGGFIIVPPSAKEGKKYIWNEDADPFTHTPAEFPEFLRLARNNRHHPPNQFPFQGAFTQGERNAALTRVAGLLRSLGGGYEQVLLFLKAQNLERCDPPLPDRELEAIARSASNYPPYGTHVDPETPGVAPPVVVQELAAFPHSDVGFAQIITFFLNGRVAFDHSRGAWYLFNGTAWELDVRERIIQQTLDVVSAYKEAVRRLADADDRKEGLKFAASLEFISKIQSGLQLTRSHPQIAVTNEQWNQDPDLFGVRNGIIHLPTGGLRQGEASDFISHSAPVAHTPDAQAPRFMQFLEEIFPGNADMQAFIQRVMGYAMTGHNREQCFFMLVGSGSNGKSILLKTLGKLLGTYALTTPFSTFEKNPVNSSNTNDLAAMLGKRMVFSSETNEGSILNEARIKSLTGGDRLSARFLHQEFFEFTPVCKILLGVNHPPRVTDDTEGFWRRMRRLDFLVQFLGDMIDDQLDEKLFAELPGILNWALEGAKIWYANGLMVPSVVLNSTKTYRTDSDPLAGFFTEQCELGERAWVGEQTIYKAYRNYASTQVLKNYEVLPSTRFHARLRRMFERQTVNGDPGYLGLRLKEPGLSLVSSGEVRVTRKKGNQAHA